MSRVVVDTNVARTANKPEWVSRGCKTACAKALKAAMRGQVCIDRQSGRSEIVAEYRRRLSAKGQPGPGDAFLAWVLRHQYADTYVIRIPITKKEGSADDFLELPAPPEGVNYDPSDRKFLAVAHAAEPKAEILQATDSKWWGWRQALADIGVKVQFLCEEEIKAKYAQKMGSPP